MMKQVYRCSLLLLFVFISCNTTDTVVAPDAEEPTDQEMPIDAPRIEVVNAFPNLNFSKPLDLQSPSDGTNRIFVVEQRGTITVFSNEASTSESSRFLDIQSNVLNRSELGLLSLAFHPNYSTNGLFYVAYTPSADLLLVSRFQVSSTDSNTADASSETILLRVAQPFENHNGGQLAFGADGYLYIASGDGGSSGDPQGNAQNLSNLLGKILRIDVDAAENGLPYAIPSDNPFVATAEARDEIYAYGLRNPWRFSFDVQTNTLWAGDVGQNAFEEIDVIENGGNYGWNITEGNSCFKASTCDTNGLIAPVFEYDQSANDRSITGGYVYRGTAVNALQGLYVYGDFISGRIWSLSTALEAELTNTLVAETGLNIASFGTDAANELYICAFDGSIYKFQESTN